MKWKRFLRPAICASAASLAAVQRTARRVAVMFLTRAQAREFDRRAIEEYGVPGVVLMENAGRGVAVQVRKYNPKKRRVVVCCGKGNNGGDGFVIARHLENFGWPVKILLFANPSEL